MVPKEEPEAGLADKPEVKEKEELKDRTVELVCQAVQLLSEKAQFLKEMLVFEIDNKQNNITCVEHPFKAELKYFVY